MQIYFSNNDQKYDQIYLSVSQLRYLYIPEDFLFLFISLFIFGGWVLFFFQRQSEYFLWKSIDHFILFYLFKFLFLSVRRLIWTYFTLLPIENNKKKILYLSYICYLHSRLKIYTSWESINYCRGFLTT